jgi:excisionase family DNA binding protein
MAGMFYTMQEVMETLGKSEQEVRNLIKDGKIREYRDGTSILYKRDEVTKLSDGTEIIDIVADSETNLELEKTAEIQLEPDDDNGKKKPTSEGGFGLSQMGDLTKADTNVGSLGINVLGGTDDQYKITADTHAETKVADMDAIDRLDADANLESAGSGSGLLDLSLQADDTSLGAVLDDILPSGEEAPLQADAAPADFAKEADGLSEGQPAVNEHGEPLPACGYGRHGNRTGNVGGWPNVHRRAHGSVIFNLWHYDVSPAGGINSGRHCNSRRITRYFTVDNQVLVARRYCKPQLGNCPGRSPAAAGIDFLSDCRYFRRPQR